MSDLNHLPIVESCAGCGACCTNMEIPPFNFRFDEAGQPHANGHPDGDHELGLYLAAPAEARALIKPLPAAFSAEAACVWLDPQTRACRYYEFRPQLCRDFERGGLSCLGQRVAAGVEARTAVLAALASEQAEQDRKRKYQSLKALRKSPAGKRLAKTISAGRQGWRLEPPPRPSAGARKDEPDRRKP